MDRALIDHFREKLQRRRHDLVADNRSMVRSDLKLRAGRVAEYEEEMQDDQMITTLEALGASNDGEIAEIDAALARIEAGTYGRCEVDGGDIDPARLEALPYTRLCAVHAGERAFERGARPPDSL